MNVLYLVQIREMIEQERVKTVQNVLHLSEAVRHFRNLLAIHEGSVPGSRPRYLHMLADSFDLYEYNEL